VQETSRLTAMGIAALLLAGSGQAAAAAGQAFDKTYEICARQVARTERAEGIPRHLLGAIALAESGRWDEARQASFAWPWTVTAEGEGRFYASKAAAVAAVKALMARDVTNVDVGCMQVNLFYHGGAFRSIEEALDPGANVAYAADYLKGLFGAAGSWSKAAGFYHSTNPERGRSYRQKVMRLWALQRPATVEKEEPADEESVATVSAPPKPVPVDTARSAALNARLRKARAAARHAAEDGGASTPVAGLHRFDRHRRVPALAPAAPAQRIGDAIAAAVQRARAESRQHPEARTGDDGARFAERRRTQLENWRRTGAWGGSS